MNTLTAELPQPRTDQSDAPAPFQFHSQEPWPGPTKEISTALHELATRADDIFGLGESDVVVSGLAIIASALGRWQSADDGLVQIPPAFNVLFVAEPNVQTGWMNYLAKAWSTDTLVSGPPNRATIQAAIRSGLGQMAFNRSNEAGHGDWDIHEGPPVPHEMSMTSTGRQLICRELDPVSLSEAAARSPDHCVTILNGALDPLMEWMTLSKAGQEQLNGMLRSSWKGIPIKHGKQAELTQPSINLVGTTTINALRLFIVKAAIQKIPPPILFVR